MNSPVFLVVLFLPLIFSLCLIYKKITTSFINKNVLSCGAIFTVLLSFIAAATKNITEFSNTNAILTYTSFVFLNLSILSHLYFKFKKQYMFTNIRYYIFFLLFVGSTYLFILSTNLISSAIIWVLSGLLIYIFSYFDIFKTGADYNTNRYYSIILIGDFCFVLCIFVLAKYAIVLNSGSYIINFDNIKPILKYMSINAPEELTLLSVCTIISLFSRAFIFPFSCFWSFLLNASNIFYTTIFPILTPSYSLILFFKLDIFKNIPIVLKFYFIAAILFILVSLLIEKHFKIIFGHILSLINISFILLYFCSKNLAFLLFILLYLITFYLSTVLLLKDKTSFKRRIVNVEKGFIQERFMIWLFECIPARIALLIEAIDKIIFRNLYKIIYAIINYISYCYVRFSQRKDAIHIVKGIVIIFTFFLLIAIFATLFGNFGEMQS